MHVRKLHFFVAYLLINVQGVLQLHVVFSPLPLPPSPGSEGGEPVFCVVQGVKLQCHTLCTYNPPPPLPPPPPPTTTTPPHQP